MNRKFHGAMAVALILLSLSAGVVYPLFRPQAAKNPPLPNVHLPFDDKWVPTQGDLREITGLEQKLAGLARLAKPEPENTRLTLFTGPTEKKRAPAPPKDINRPGYTVTLTFVSGKKRYCMVNKRLYTTGEPLPGGETILEIEPRRIRIEKEGQSMWIALSSHPGKTVAATGQGKRM